MIFVSIPLSNESQFISQNISIRSYACHAASHVPGEKEIHGRVSREDVWGTFASSMKYRAVRNSLCFLRSCFTLHTITTQVLPEEETLNLMLLNVEDKQVHSQVQQTQLSPPHGEQSKRTNAKKLKPILRRLGSKEKGFARQDRLPHALG